MARQECDYYGGEIYSTDETQIGYVNLNGTINNVYRKVFTGTYPSSYSGTISISHGITNLNRVYRVNGFINKGGLFRSISSASYAALGWNAQITVSSTTINIDGGQNWFNAVSGGAYTITIEYTKS